MKTYEIIDATVQHPDKGEVVKENIVYYDENGEEVNREIYSIGGKTIGLIRQGYNLLTKK